MMCPVSTESSAPQYTALLTFCLDLSAGNQHLCIIQRVQTERKQLGLLFWALFCRLQINSLKEVEQVRFLDKETSLVSAKITFRVI